MLNHNRPKVTASPEIEPGEEKTTPTQDLILRLLWAQHRLGNTLIDIDSKNAKALDGLERMKLVWTKHGVVERTLQVGLDKRGRDLMAEFKTPLEEKLAAAETEVRVLRDAIRNRVAD